MKTAAGIPMMRPPWISVLILWTCWGTGVAATAPYMRPSMTSWVLIGAEAVSAFAAVASRKAARVRSGDSLAALELALVLLSPPGVAFIAPAAVRIGVRRCPWSASVPAADAAAAGVAGGLVSVVFHLAVPSAGPRGLGSGPWVLAVLIAGTIHAGLRAAVHRAGPGCTTPARERISTALAELVVGLILTGAVAASPLYVILAWPLGSLLYRSVRYPGLVQQARLDAKTGLLNAAAWERHAEIELSRAARDRAPSAVVLLDLDHFKLINDRYGHLGGDQVLSSVARQLAAQLREYDIAGRFGGEEFVILLPGTDLAQARRIAERLRRSVADTPVSLASTQAVPASVRVTLSAGVASTSSGPVQRGLRELLEAADAACYEAKGAGRNRVRTRMDQTAPSPSMSLDGQHAGAGPEREDTQRALNGAEKQ